MRAPQVEGDDGADGVDGDPGTDAEDGTDASDVESEVAELSSSSIFGAQGARAESVATELMETTKVRLRWEAVEAMVAGEVTFN